jgi:hypothetical protein
MQADPAPAWLLAWQEQQRQPRPAPPPPPPKPVKVPKPPEPPPPPPKPKPPPQIPVFSKSKLLGLQEPDTWAYDGGKRREPVLDMDFHPPRVVRKVGWRHCLKCERPFFSEDVVRQRLCSGGWGCRDDEDRFTVLR